MREHACELGCACVDMTADQGEEVTWNAEEGRELQTSHSAAERGAQENHRRIKKRQTGTKKPNG